MALGDMDERVEMLLGFAYTLTAAASVGAGDATLLGVGLLDVIHSTGYGFVLDVATLGSAASLAAVWWSNRPKIGNMGIEYQGMILAAVALVIYGAYEPGFASDQTIAVQLLLVSVSLGGYWALAHN